MPEIRRTKLVLNEIIVSTERSIRPDEFRKKELVKCPFCPGNEDMTPPPELIRFVQSGRWTLRGIPNKFPALRIEGNSQFLLDGALSATIADAHGAHEVVVETPEHECDYGLFDAKKIEEILNALNIRTQDLYKDPQIRYIVVFKNYGDDAGASLRHEHSQIIGLPQIPFKIRSRLASLEDYYADHGKSIFTTSIERAHTDERVVFESKHFICIVPYEAKFPYEMWILPVEPKANFTSSQKIYYDLGVVISDAFKRLKVLFGALPPFNCFVDDAPPQKYRNCDSFFSWRFRIMPRLTKIAGFELASGCFINPGLPEEAAKTLREVQL